MLVVPITAQISTNYRAALQLLPAIIAASVSSLPGSVDLLMVSLCI